MPFSFTSRSWELLSIRSIDVLDTLCSTIRIDTHNNKIMRILPSLEGFTNDEWITNKARFGYDSLIFRDYIFLKYLIILNLL